jgi:hypothetical protein
MKRFFEEDEAVNAREQFTVKTLTGLMFYEPTIAVKFKQLM